MADDKPAPKETPSVDDKSAATAKANAAQAAVATAGAAQSPAEIKATDVLAAAMADVAGRLSAVEKQVGAVAKEAPGVTAKDFAAMLAEIKAWARKELHLHANGASHEEREQLNP